MVITAVTLETESQLLSREFEKTVQQEWFSSIRDSIFLQNVDKIAVHCLFIPYRQVGHTIQYCKPKNFFHCFRVNPIRFQRDILRLIQREFDQAIAQLKENDEQGFSNLVNMNINLYTYFYKDGCKRASSEFLGDLLLNRDANRTLINCEFSLERNELGECLCYYLVELYNFLRDTPTIIVRRMAHALLPEVQNLPL